MPTKEATKDAVTDTATTDAATTTDAPTTNGETDKAKGGARPRPTYAAEKVQELPADLTMPKSGPRPDPKFIEALQVAMSDPGEWYCVGTYQSANGARSMLKRVTLPDDNAKKVKLPGPGDWEVQARRVQAPGGDENARWSKLFAKFLG